MHERIEKIKTHFREHKEAYVTGGICLGFAAITTLIMRDDNDDNDTLRDASTMKNPTYWEHGSSDGKPPYVAHRPVESHPTWHTGFSFDNSIINAPVNNIVNVSERDGRGHPGYMVRCIEDDLTYFSQKDAAFAYGVTQSHMSDHLNGRLEHIDGKHFERIQLAA